QARSFPQKRKMEGDLASGVASVIHFSSCIATPCAATRVSAASSPASFYSSSSSLTSPAASPSSLCLVDLMVVVDDEETVMESAFGNASAITDQRQKTEGNAVQKHILSAVISSSDIVQARRFIDHMSLDDVPLVVSRQLLQTFARVGKITARDQERNCTLHPCADSASRCVL
ncbi:hypothetical protein S83_007221, partial [Arachis hypogaea]